MNPIFKRAWKRLASVGKCDGWAGAECRRVYSEWKEVGCPSRLEDFIYERATVSQGWTTEQAEVNLVHWKASALRENEEIRIAYAGYKDPSIVGSEGEDELAEDVLKSLDLHSPEAEAFFFGYAAAIEAQQEILCDALQEHSLLPSALEKALRNRRKHV